MSCLALIPVTCHLNTNGLVPRLHVVLCLCKTAVKYRTTTALLYGDEIKGLYYGPAQALVLVVFGNADLFDVADSA